MKKNLKRHHTSSLLEPIEPRFMMAADLAGLETSTQDQANQDLEATTNVVLQSAQAQIENSDELLNEQDSLDEQRKEIVFINDDVQNYEDLIKDIEDKNTNTTVEIIVLDATTDNLDTVSQTLENRDDINAIHIISHGNDDGFALGGTWVNNDTLSENNESFTSWSNALNEDADILLYGCELALDEDGKNISDTLSELTGADVASSDDLTGANELQADWDLEYKTGSIETQIAISESLQSTWNHTLETTTLTNGEDTYLNGDTGFFFSGNQQDQNFGNESSVIVSSDNNYQEGLLKFAIFDNEGGSIPVGSNITSATLTLNVTASDYTDNMDIQIREMLQSWDENTVTWDTFDGLDGDISSTIIASELDEQGTGTITIDVTSSLVNWSAGGTNNGWAFVDADTSSPVFFGSDVWAFSSSETGNAPQLEINYNAAPIAVDDSLNAVEDTAIASTVDLDANDSDPDGDSISVVAGTFTTDEGGTLVLAADGSYTYTPAENFNGIDTVEYTISDGNLSDTGTLTITVSSVNDLPTAFSDNFSVDEDSSISENVSTNDTLSGDGGNVFSKATDPNNGTLVFNSDGSFVYTPDANYFGADSFQYTLSDINGDSHTVAVFLTVNSINDLPIAVDDTFTYNVNASVSGNLSSNDTLSGDGNNFYSVLSNPSNGFISLNANGDFTYTPFTNFNGTDSFTYTLRDANGDVSTATVTLNLDSGNTVPIAVDDSFNINEDTTLSNDLSTNDTASNDGGNTYTKASDPSNGTLSINADGSFTYIPDANFNGTDSFTYTITDANSDTSTATVTLNVQAIEDLPTASDNTLSIDEDTTLTFQPTNFNFSDVDGDSLQSITITSLESVGNLQLLGVNVVLNQVISFADISAGNLKFVPLANNNGVAYDSFSFSVNDSKADSASYTMTINVDPVNDAPIAGDLVISISEDVAYSSSPNSLLDNDSDIDADTLSAVTGTFATTQGGSIVIASDGTYTYTPPANFNGVDSFDYTLSDGVLTDTGRLTINIGAINDAPDAVNDTETTNEDTSLIGNVISNDSDIDGDSITVTAGTFATTQGGQIVLATDGSYTYTPLANFNGVDSFNYTLSDGSLSSIGTLTITVNAVNDAPVTVDDAIFVPEDTVFNSTINLTANDTDLDGDSLSVVVETIATAQGGSISFASNGSYTYTPPASFNGTDSVSYTLSDGVLTDTAILTINVGAVNDAPTAVDDTDTTLEDNSTTGNVISNDSDIDGDTITVTAGTFATSQGGQLVLASDGSYTYTPPANFNGTDTYSYTLNDGSLSDIATLSITVTADNDAPIAVDDVISTSEDTVFTSSVDLDFNDTDVDNPSLSVVAGTFTTSQGGEIIIAADGSYTYTPAANFNGVDSYTYTLSDGVLNDTATLSINVNALNDAPLALDDTVNVVEDTPFNSVIDLDFNDTDVDGDALSVISGTFTTSQGGEIVIASDGSYTYTPPANFNGTDTVSYTVSDGISSDIATLNLNVSAVNDDPIAVDDAVSTTEDTALIGNVLSNDTDVDADTLSTNAGTFATTQGGQIIIASDGSYTYTPPANFNGMDSFNYTLSDGSLSDTATLSITVSAVNDAPTAVNDTQTTAEDTPVSGNVLTNDSDIDEDSINALAGTFSTVQGGQIVMASDGSYTYTPAPSFNGTDSFVYTLTDGDLNSTATLTLNVTSVNDAPIAVNDTISTAEDTAVSGNLLSNDSDIDADTLSTNAGTFTTTQGGQIIIASDGSYTYTPPANFYGSDSFSYTLSDGSLSDTATLTISISSVNDLPLAVNDNFSGNEDNAITNDISLNDTLSGDGGNTFAKVLDPSNGTVVLNTDGTFTYTPNANYNGNDSFTYTITDINGDSSTATVFLSVNPVNDVPIAVDDSFSLNEDASITNNLSTNDTASGDGGNTYTQTTGPLNGTLLINADGSFTYTPTANYNGPDSFTYTLTDADGSASTATVNLNITPTNDLPDAQDDSFSLNEDGVLNATLSANDTASADGGNTYTQTTGPLNGTLLINTDGSFTYTPDADYNGNDSFSYTLQDADGDSSTAIVNITINAVNDVTVVVADTIDLQMNTSSSVNVLANDIDVDGLEASLVSVSDGEHGVVTFDTSTGIITYTPDTDYYGSDSFTYTNSEGNSIIVNVNIAQDPSVPLTQDPDTDEPLPEDDTTVNENPLEQENENEEEELLIFNPHTHTQILPNIASGSGESESLEFSSLVNDSANDYKTPDNIKTIIEQNEPQALQLKDLNENVFNSSNEHTRLEEDLEKMRLELERDFDEQGRRHAFNVETATGIGVSLTAGFVAWTLRSGALLASLFSAMPMWRNFDPISILGAGKKENDAETENTAPPKEHDTKQHTKAEQIFDDSSLEEAI